MATRTPRAPAAKTATRAGRSTTAKAAKAPPRLPECGYAFDGKVCRKRGDHLCSTRAGHVIAFFGEVLVHTKGDYARQTFVLAKWQRDEIIIPMMATVRWDPNRKRYVRRYRIAWIELARKNGKSELLAALALYLLAADGEEGCEVYGCALDRDQARKVWDVAARMVQLSPALSSRLLVRKNPARIVFEQTYSYYEVLSSDASGNLGHNPHAILFDEIISQPDGKLWDAMRTGMGARSQPIMIAATTAGDDPSSFAAQQHAEMVKVAEDPERSPHIFVYCRNLPIDADPWDEDNWAFPNPALDDYLSRDALREEANEARNDPTKENTFRQFRLNQWVQQATRWMPLHHYDEVCGEPWLTPTYRRDELSGREAWGGLDLAAKHDLTSLFWLLPGKGTEPAEGLWRFWAPESALRDLDVATNGNASVWVRDGWLTLTEGNVVDYEFVVGQIAEDAAHFKVRSIDYDKWSGEPVRQAIMAKAGIEMVSVEPTYVGMTTPMTELMSLTLNRGWRHHGNPVARWNFDSVEARRPPDNPDLIKPVKPARKAGAARIDGVVATALAVGAWRSRGQIAQKPRYVYGMRG